MPETSLFASHLPPSVTGWDVVVVGSLSLLIGVALGAWLFLPQLRSRRATNKLNRKLPPKQAAGHAPQDWQERQSDHQLAIGKHEVIKELRLHNVDLVCVSDREGKKNDAFWAIVSGEMIAYDEIAEWETYRLACGAMTEAEDTALQLKVAEEFRATSALKRTRELWKFLRMGDVWLLDEISHDLTEVDDMPQPFSDDVYEVK